jgi:hypothetical protein
MMESSSEPRSSIGADEEEDAANDLDHALDVEERIPTGGRSIGLNCPP